MVRAKGRMRMLPWARGHPATFDRVVLRLAGHGKQPDRCWVYGALVIPVYAEYRIEKMGSERLHFAL